MTTQRPARNRQRPLTANARCPVHGKRRTQGSASVRRDPTVFHRDLSFVVVDMVDSTALLRLIGPKRFSRMCRAYQQRISACATEHRGTVVSTAGDGALLMFRRRWCALAFALDVCKRLDHPTRVGFACGPGVVLDGEPFSLAIVIATRLAAAASPGRVAAEGTSVSGAASSTVRTVERRRAELKGVGLIEVVDLASVA